MPDAVVPPIAGRRLVLPQVAAFVAVGVVLLARNQATYDLVDRQQLAALLWWGLSLAFLAGLLPRTRPAVSGFVPFVALVLFGIWTAASLSWTDSAERSLTEAARVAAHLGLLLLVATAFDRSTWRAGVGGAAAGAAVICGAAFASRMSGGDLGSDVVAQAFSLKRLSYPLGYWNAVGAWAGLTSALCLGLSAHNRTALGRAAALACVPLAIVVSYLTYSRASLAGTAFGLLLVLALARNRWTTALHAAVAAAGGAVGIAAVRDAPQVANGVGTEGAGTIILAVVLAAALTALVAAATGRMRLDDVRLPLTWARVALGVGTVVVIVAALTAGGPIASDAWDQFKQNRNVITDDPAARLTNLNGSRYEIWRAALRADESALTGSGAGTFEFTWNRTGTTSEFVRDAHSLYIESLTELGIPGLLLILAFVAGVAWAIWTALRRNPEPADRGALAAASGAIGAYAFGAGVDWMWESTAVTAIALALTGCVIAAGGTAAGRLALPARLVLTVVALAMALVQLPGLTSTSDVRSSQNAMARGDFDAARVDADHAVETQPWAATPRIQRALVAEASGQLRQANADLRAAQEREPRNWRIPLLRARVLARLGEPEAAIRSYKRAKALRPRGNLLRER